MCTNCRHQNSDDGAWNCEPCAENPANCRGTYTSRVAQERAERRAVAEALAARFTAEVAALYPADYSALTGATR